MPASLPTLSVFGLGYVGSVTAAALASRGHRVIGVDVATAKVDQINRGEAPIAEPGLDDLIAEQVTAGRLSATSDAAAAVGDSEVSLICVGTPSTASGSLDLRYVEAVAAEISEALAQKGTPHHVVFRSTMLPGSTRQLAKQHFGEAIASSRLRVAFYPEFLRQGSALADFKDPSLSAIGLLDPADEADPLPSWLEPGAERVDLEVAELLKYACNAYHATKIGFANEIGRIGKAAGIDSTEVMRLLCQDQRLNISSAYLRPGTPFGGSCLPKDLSALNHFALLTGVSAPALAGLQESNEKHLDALTELVEAAEPKRVVLLGLAFKAGTDDLRGSAMLDLATRLLLRQVDLRIVDPDIAPRNLIGANERLAALKLPQLGDLLIPGLDGDAATESRLLVASKPCVPITDLQAALGPNDHVIDVNGWPDLRSAAEKAGATYEGLCW